MNIVNNENPRTIKVEKPLSVGTFGNYNFSFKEQIVFPEINFDKVDRIHGINITIVTTAKTKEEAIALLKEYNMPFRDKE